MPDKSVPDKSVPDKSVPDKSVPDKSVPDKCAGHLRSFVLENIWLLTSFVVSVAHVSCLFGC